MQRNALLSQEGDFTRGRNADSNTSVNYVLVLSTPFIIFMKPQATTTPQINHHGEKAFRE